MAQEIERKFLLKNDDWRIGAEGKRYRQGYLSTEAQRTVRVRTVSARGFLTIKGEPVGAARVEFEYPIPPEDANEMLDSLCQRPIIEKVRFRIPHGSHTWEVDEFEGENAGLLIAEVELESENETLDIPDWVGEEVTGDSRYYNANLIATPFSDW